jgi:hypothetical protein
MFKIPVLPLIVLFCLFEIIAINCHLSVFNEIKRNGMGKILGFIAINCDRSKFHSHLAPYGKASALDHI